MEKEKTGPTNKPTSFIKKAWSHKTVKVIAVILIIVIAVPYMLKVGFLESMPGFTNYVPFSGVIFDIDPEDISELYVCNRDGGYLCEGDDLKYVVNVLNSARYKSSWYFPSLFSAAAPGAGGAKEVWVDIRLTGGETYSCKNIDESSVTFNTRGFNVEKGYFTDLIAFIDRVCAPEQETAE